MTRCTLPLFLGLCVSTSALGSPSIPEALNDHKTRIQLNTAMDAINSEERKRRKVLTGLPDAMAKAMLSPTVQKGEFIGGGTQPSFDAELSFSPGKNTKTLIDKIELAIGGGNKGQRVCISAEDEPVDQFFIREPATTTFLKALGTSVQAIEPVPHFLTEVGDDKVVIERSLQGTRLFSEIQDGLEGLAEGQSLEIFLEVSSGPAVGVSKRPTKLILTTTDGRQLNLEVEIDTPAKSIADHVPAGAMWRIKGSSKRVPFDRGYPGQIALLAVLLKNGKIQLSNAERIDDYPIHRQSVTGGTYDFHALGMNNAWFTQAELQVLGQLTVNRTPDDSCDIALGITSSTRTVLVGPLPTKTWERVTRFRPTERGAEIVDLGYLNGPACGSDPSPGSFEPFDMSLTLEDDCAQFCAGIEQKIQRTLPAAMLMGSISNEVASVLGGFTADGCMPNCLKSNEFRACMNNFVAPKDRVSALRSGKASSSSRASLDTAYICISRRPFRAGAAAPVATPRSRPASKAASAPQQRDRSAAQEKSQNTSSDDPATARLNATALLQNSREDRVAMKRAFDLMRVACDGNDAKGCALLSEMYLKGIGHSKNLSSARAALRKACKLGDSPSCRK